MPIVRTAEEITLQYQRTGQIIAQSWSPDNPNPHPNYLPAAYGIRAFIYWMVTPSAEAPWQPDEVNPEELRYHGGTQGNGSEW